MQRTSAQKPVVALVYPGNSGRKPVFDRIRQLVDVFVIFPNSEMRNNWIGKEGVEFATFDSCESQTKEFANALALLKNFETITGRSIGGIICYDELGVELSAFLCETLKLPGTPLATVKQCRSKVSFRERLQETGVCSMKYIPLKPNTNLDQALHENPDFTFPAILKPAQGLGSFHVRKVRNPIELKMVYEKVSHALQESKLPSELKDAGFTLEEYFPGVEVDIDGSVVDGQILPCVISENKPLLEPYFLEQGGTYPCDCLTKSELDALYKLTKDVVNAFPDIHGCFHFEAKVNSKRIRSQMMADDLSCGSIETYSSEELTQLTAIHDERSVGEDIRVFPIELNLRIGGAECPASVEAVSGLNLPTLVVDFALGKIPNLHAALSGLSKFSKKGIYISKINGSSKKHEASHSGKFGLCDMSPKVTSKSLYPFVCSINLYAEHPGRLKSLSLRRDNTVDTSTKEKLKIVQCQLFTEFIGQEIFKENGISSCPGWIAVGGNIEEEAQRNLCVVTNMVKITME